jgi:hypothetical protein
MGWAIFSIEPSSSVVVRLLDCAEDFLRLVDILANRGSKTMCRLFVIALTLLLSGCTRLMADYHLDNAYRYYAEGNCSQVALELSQSERGIRARPYLQPEISLLRGQCLERENLFVDAQQTYQFIVSHYPGSEYAYRAKARLNTLEQLGHLRGAEVKVSAQAL